MKRHFLIGIFILAIMVASGSIAYAATHKLDKTLTVSVNVTAAPPIEEQVYSDEQLTHPVTTLAFTYPKGGSANTTVYVSGNITPDSLAFYPTNLPGDLMIASLPQTPLSSGVIPILITAIGGDEGHHGSVTLRITGEGN